MNDFRVENVVIEAIMQAIGDIPIVSIYKSINKYNIMTQTSSGRIVRWLKEEEVKSEKDLLDVLLTHSLIHSQHIPHNEELNEEFTDIANSLLNKALTALRRPIPQIGVKIDTMDRAEVVITCCEDMWYPNAIFIGVKTKNMDALSLDPRYIDIKKFSHYQTKPKATSTYVRDALSAITKFVDAPVEEGILIFETSLSNNSNFVWKLAIKTGNRKIKIETEDPEDITKAIEHFSNYTGKNTRRNVLMQNNVIMPKWGDLLTEFTPFSIEIINDDKAKLTTYE